MINRTRLLLLGLIASLALNLFFIGGIVSRMNDSDGFSGRPLPPNVSWMIRDLSEARRSELQPLMTSSAEEIAPIRRQLFEAQRRVNQLMADPDYDQVALAQAFATLRETNLRYQEMSHQHSVAMLNELTAEERQIAVELINRRGPRDGRFRRNDDDRSDSEFGAPRPGPGTPPGPPPANF